MSDIRAELLAELDRREALARAATSGAWYANPPAWPDGTANVDVGEGEAVARWRNADFNDLSGERVREADAAHIAANDPASVLRQLAGVRAVVEMHRREGLDVCGYCWEQIPGSCREMDWPCPTIRALHDAYCGRPE